MASELTLKITNIKFFIKGNVLFYDIVNMVTNRVDQLWRYNNYMSYNRSLVFHCLSDLSAGCNEM